MLGWWYWRCERAVPFGSISEVLWRWYTRVIRSGAIWPLGAWRWRIRGFHSSNVFPVSLSTVVIVSGFGRRRGMARRDKRYGSPLPLFQQSGIVQQQQKKYIDWFNLNLWLSNHRPAFNINKCVINNLTLVSLFFLYALFIEDFFCSCCPYLSELRRNKFQWMWGSAPRLRSGLRL